MHIAVIIGAIEEQLALMILDEVEHIIQIFNFWFALVANSICVNIQRVCSVIRQYKELQLGRTGAIKSFACQAVTAKHPWLQLDIMILLPRISHLMQK